MHFTIVAFAKPSDGISTREPTVPNDTDLREDRVKEFLRRNPQVVEAMDAWSKSTVQYEEAFRQFLIMPVAYSSTSTVSGPPQPRNR
jgi:hypothetical protein